MRSHRYRYFPPLLLIAVLLGLAVVSPGCSGGAATGNLLLNPSFEEGAEPWISLDPESTFEVSQAQAHSGFSSALLHMEDPVEAEGSKVYYLVQEISPEEFPEVLQGNYFVENWSRGTAKQYLQFVVIAIGAKNNPIAQANNFQLRYLLTGIDRDPFEIGNAKFIYFQRELEPVQGQWIHFEADVKGDFQRYWGGVPEDFEKLRILFEVRYDDKIAGDGAPRADVYYDDLSFGSDK
jgi:hypothetical protein